MAFGRVGTCIVLVHSVRPPAEDEWLSYIEFLERHRGLATTILVFSEGGAPDVTQRAKLKDTLSSHMPTAVLTHSAIARGVVTAISWFYPRIRAFAPNDVEGALKWLQVGVSYFDEIRRLLHTLRAQVAPS